MSPMLTVNLTSSEWEELRQSWQEYRKPQGDRSSNFRQLIENLQTRYGCTHFDWNTMIGVLDQAKSDWRGYVVTKNNNEVAA